MFNIVSMMKIANVATVGDSDRCTWNVSATVGDSDRSTVLIIIKPKFNNTFPLINNLFFPTAIPKQFVIN